MERRTFYLIVLTIFLSVVTFSQVKITDNLTLNLNGTFNTWFQYQQDFWFGKGTYNDAYIVQMLRFRPEISYKGDVKIITRFDMAQGWWGVDNEPPLRKVYGGKVQAYCITIRTFIIYFMLTRHMFGSGFRR
ncbi:hypothetical protein JGI14_100160 [Candidatus Kryptonium thompsonii]|uniref:hypothetical protein n=1 Tax=Candidatus Kryptonium thompsonii TaxID=1633631 RepID=UPI000707E42B|nr:hypothetical protein [Candidatus Kryptonium thompsoni]CUS76889.1 hypothetical protein JGI14_100160 [Candidatus Kryptonium thompsoni]CUS92855.1 hypothetical protein JGI13_02151 [Candidatus Kryptonium thompsoni]